jgi:hypothetical protein
MVWVHYLQQRLSFTNEAVEVRMHDFPGHRAITGSDRDTISIPEATAAIRACHPLDRHDLPTALLVAANPLHKERGIFKRHRPGVPQPTLGAPSITTNQTGTRSLKTYQATEETRWFFGISTRFGANTDSALVHTVVAHRAAVHAELATGAILQGALEVVQGHSDYRRSAQLCDAPSVDRHMAMQPASRWIIGLRSADNVVQLAFAQLRTAVRHPSMPSDHSPNT